MKNVAIISLFLTYTFNTFASCDCVALVNGKSFFTEKAKSKLECKGRIFSNVLDKYISKDNRICTNKNVNITLKWSCDKEIKLNKFEDMKLDCNELDELQAIRTVTKAIKQSTELATYKDVDPQEIIDKNINCDNRVIMNPISEKKTSFIIESKEKLKSFINEITNSKGKSYLMDNLDRSESGSFSIGFLNDNSITDVFEKGGKSDDIGHTHGFKIKYVKNIEDGKYNIQVTYESDIYTNFENPENPEFSKAEDGTLQVNQYFVEENVFKIAIAKAKFGDSYHFNFGVGYQEINTKDTNRNVLFSTLKQQAYAHDFINSKKSNGAREYNSIASGRGNDASLFVDATLGNRKTFYESEDADVRVFVDYEASTRLTKVHNASNVGLKAELNTDYNITGDVNMRVGAGYDVKAYAGGDIRKSSYVHFIIANKSYSAKFKVENPGSEEPDYRNPMPFNYEGRNNLSLNDESIWTLTVEKKF